MSRARILLVENEPLIALELAGTIAESGGIVTAVARTCFDALGLAAAAEIDAAVLDVCLPDGMIFPAAEVLARRGIPFVFCTGDSGDGSQFGAWTGVPVVSKPFRPDVVIGTVAMLIAGEIAAADPSVRQLKTA